MTLFTNLSIIQTRWIESCINLLFLKKPQTEIAKQPHYNQKTITKNVRLDSHDGLGCAFLLNILGFGKTINQFKIYKYWVKPPVLKFVDKNISEHVPSYSPGWGVCFNSTKNVYVSTDPIQVCMVSTDSTIAKMCSTQACYVSTEGPQEFVPTFCKEIICSGGFLFRPILKITFLGGLLHDFCGPNLGALANRFSWLKFCIEMLTNIQTWQ